MAGDKVQAGMMSVPLFTRGNVTCFHSDKDNLSAVLFLYPGASLGFSICGFTCRLRCPLGWGGRGVQDGEHMYTHG